MRRGLGGEVVQALSVVTTVSPHIVVAVGMILAQCTFLFFGWRLARQILRRPGVWLLLASPAIFLFPTFDGDGALRKEVLLFAALAWCLNAARSGRQMAAVRAFALAAPVIVLIHEGLYACLPYGLALLAFGTPSRGTFVWAATGAIAASLAFALSLLFPGTPGHVAAICADLARWPSLDRAADCPGISAIGWLAHGRSIPPQMDAAARGEMLPWIAPAIALVLAGFVPAAVALARGPEPALHWPLAGFGLALLASLPLFWVALDWGRFVHIHATCLCLVILALLARQTTGPPQKRPSALVVSGMALVALVYASTWHLQHYRQPLILESGVWHWLDAATEARAYFSRLIR